jgi:hypothetical protein
MCGCDYCRRLFLRRDPIDRLARTGIHRMPVLLKLRLPLSTDFGNAKRSTRGSRQPKPVTSARRAPDNADFVGIKTHPSLGF